MTRNRFDLAQVLPGPADGLAGSEPTVMRPHNRCERWPGAGHELDGCPRDVFGDMVKRVRIVLAILGCALVLAACVAGVNPEVGTAAPDGGGAGFWQGLWH